MKPFKAVVAEPSDVIRRTLGHMLRSRGVTTAEAPTLSSAQAYLDADQFDVLIVSLDQADGAGDAFLREDVLHWPDRLRVLLWPDSRGPAPESLEEACEILVKPFNDGEVRQLLQRLRQKLEGSSATEEFLLPHPVRRPLLGRSAPMLALQQLIQQVAQTDATVLIQGESGTGKELIARALHAQGLRSKGPFISLNCAALPDSLIESELFGHEKGSFTGALARREGRFELANGGTLLLDEVTEVSAGIQAKLLRVLQEREFERVGGNRPVRVDVRVVATSNRNLESAIAAGLFREDLYFRLNVVPIHVPPLRERVGDIALLAEHFLAQFRAKYQSHASGFTRAAMAVLEAHHWPGNVRELQNIIERAVITTPTPLIEAAQLSLQGRGSPLRLGQTPLRLATGGPRPEPIRNHLAEPPCPILPFSPQAVVEKQQAAMLHPSSVPKIPPAAEASEASAFPSIGPRPGAAPEPTAKTSSFAPQPLEEVVRLHILETIRFTRGNRNHAARLLRINIRTLRNKLIFYGRKSAEDSSPSNKAEASTEGINASQRSENRAPQDP